MRDGLGGGLIRARGRFCSASGLVVSVQGWVQRTWKDERVRQRKSHHVRQWAQLSPCMWREMIGGLLIMGKG